MRGKKALLALTALALVAAGCGRDEGGSGGGDAAAEPGITATSVKIGGSYPFSGPASAYGVIGKAVDAYFKYVNEKGGANGRKIEFITYDDGYEPQRALTNAKKLVEQDKVFALFNTLGTANNLAIWDYAAAQKVPHLYVATGAAIWGADIGKHPYTIGWQPDYLTEAKVYAKYLQDNKPNAKVAVLYQNDSFGKELLGGFEKAIEGTGVTIVARESYEVTDPSAASQVKKLAGSGADTFLDITTPKFGAQAIATVAQTTWRPLHILNAVAASKTQVLKPVGFENAQGIITAAYLKAADDPQFENDPAMQEFKTNLAKYAPGADPVDPFTVYGWSVAHTLVETLKQMSQPTRTALMDAARHLSLTPPLALPGVRAQTDGDRDTYPIQALQIAEFRRDLFVLQGEVIQPSTD